MRGPLLVHEERAFSQRYKAVPVALITLLVWGISAAGVWGCESLPRKTLALYDSDREGEPRDTRIHRYAEVVLNHMGQVVVYYDVAQETPPEVDPAEVGLVMSWFDGTAAEMPNVGKWLAQEDAFCNGGPKIVAFGNFDPWAGLQDDISNKALASMGMETDGVIYPVGVSSVVSQKNDDLLDYEADFLIEPGDYQGVVASAAALPLLQISTPGKEVALAVAGPAGGYVHATATVDTDARGQAFWIIDPFEFFQRVLQEDAVPKPDPTTFQGLRTFFVTVSSVGWLDVMPTRVFGEPERLASEVLVERLVEPFFDIPMSIAVLAGDLVREPGGNFADRGRQAAMRAFAAANVQGAAQGFSDIRDWSFFADYDEGQEAEILDAPEVEEGRDALVTSAVKTLRGAFADTGASTFSHTPGAPRKYATAPFDLGMELAGAIEQLNALSQGERPVQLYAWSGNARPFEEALEAQAATSVPAMGGGGGIMDAAGSSLTGLWPFSAQVGDYSQVYDALSGDASYTGYWTSPLYGFYRLKETLEQTENPRRLKPFQLSFAARSTIYFETRRAIASYLDLARSSEVVPIRASTYAETVQGFLSARIISKGPGTWQIRDRGALQTVRLDQAENWALDMRRSEGVMGARRKGESLYVTLDPGVEVPLVALTQEGIQSGIVLGSEAPALIESRLIVETWKRGDCGVELEVSGFAEGEVVLFGPPQARYGVAISDADQDRRQEIMADEAGLLRVLVPAAPGGLTGLSVLGAC